MQCKLEFNKITTQEEKKVTDNIIVTQKSALGSETTQIANQTNYYGMTAAEASQMAIELFVNNFPKLQEEAMKVARERIEELMQNTILEINNKYSGNYTAFSKPDMQYVLLEAQKGYARRGTRELCTMLSSLIADRSACEENSYLEVVLDKAIELVPSLSPAHLDYLTLIFAYKHVRFGNIHTLEDIESSFAKLHNSFSAPTNAGVISYFEMLGLTTLNIANGAKAVANTYGFTEKEVANVLPSQHHTIPGDYGLTPVGIVLAIFNAHAKGGYYFNLETWIHE